MLPLNLQCVSCGMDTTGIWSDRQRHIPHVALNPRRWTNDSFSNHKRNQSSSRAPCACAFSNASAPPTIDRPATEASPPSTRKIPPSRIRTPLRATAPPLVLHHFAILDDARSCARRPPSASPSGG
ncbi:hypothetical protein C8Q76DRAFT_215893 [Earliella scabrosa]|nr:hypothetical protein C8Q76DRAFT_215893 [Earliella scabrosa]